MKPCFFLRVFMIVLAAKYESLCDNLIPILDQVRYYPCEGSEPSQGYIIPLVAFRFENGITKVYP